jgi:hypothetical protein
MNEGEHGLHTFDGSLIGAELSAHSAEGGEVQKSLEQTLSNLGRRLSQELQSIAKLQEAITAQHNVLENTLMDDPARPMLESVVNGLQTVCAKQQEVTDALRRVIDDIFRLSPDFIAEGEVPEGSTIH